jgi:hypothetical protein
MDEEVIGRTPWDPKGPPTLIDLRANLDVSSEVTAWESEFFIPQGAIGNVDLVAARSQTCRPTISFHPAASSTTRRSATVVSSSISNAVFDATGVRLRSVPFKPAKVKAALESA